MKPNLLMTIILPAFVCCQPIEQHTISSNHAPIKVPTTVSNTVDEIPLAGGYRRISAAENSFAAWLRNMPLKKDKRVFLYNGELKGNQSAQFAVIDISVGKKDLQQCADAAMRLRAEYLYAQKKYSEIVFNAHNNVRFRFNNWALGEKIIYRNGALVTVNSGRSSNADPNSFNRKSFEEFLENVFSFCGSATLEKQLKPVEEFSSIQPGDVLIKGGYPGHAVIIIDVAINNAGKKIYLLAQSYMPAQDIHVLKNPIDTGLSPWYEANDLINHIYTPEWTFETKHLRSW